MRIETLYKPYFIFKGINSLDMGIVTTSLPDVVRAERRVEKVTIPGRNGDLTIDEGGYSNYTLTLEAAIIKRANIDKICAWLDGEGEAIFSTEPDKIYKVRIANQISIGKMLQYFQKFQVNFDTFPFKYSVNANDDVIDSLENNTTIFNKGTVYSEPKITITGSGNVVLTINEREYTINNLSGSITLDSEIMEIINLGGASYIPPSMDNYLFPRLEVGLNEISYSGNVSKISINPRWRWL